MKALIKGEFKRFWNKKYIFIMALLLAGLNLYITNYNYDGFLSPQYYEEHAKDSVDLVEGRITNERTAKVEQESINNQIKLQQVSSEGEGHLLNVRRFLYDDYLSYVYTRPFPLNYEGHFYENREAVLKQLENQPVDSKQHTELSTYLSLSENIEKEHYYNTGWDYLFQQGSLLFLSILLIITMASVFGEDYSSKVAPLTLSSRYGKTKLVMARLIASSFFASILLLFFFGTEILMKVWLHGTDGYQGNVSLLNFIYLPNVSAVAMLIIIFFFTLLTALCLSLLTLVVSLFTKKVLNTMLVMVVITLVAETVEIPLIRLFSLPNIVNSFYESFIVYQPINLFGNLLHGPVFLLLFLLVTGGISLALTVYKGKRQQI